MRRLERRDAAWMLTLTVVVTAVFYFILAEMCIRDSVVACVEAGDMDLDIPFELLEGFYEENGGNRK